MKKLSLSLLLLNLVCNIKSAELSRLEKNEIRNKVEREKEKITFENAKKYGCFNAYFKSLLDVRKSDRTKLLAYSLCLKKLQVYELNPSSYDHMCKKELADKIEYYTPNQFRDFCTKDKKTNEKKCYKAIVEESRNVPGDYYQDGVEEQNPSDYDSMEILYKLQQWE